jgi:purine-binding chemotaxis protein CheW
MTQQPATAELLELLVFELGAARYALPVACVREVVAAVLISPLPSAPPVVEGIIDVRGVTVPVYDLRLRFGMTPVALTPAERMILAWTGERLVAFRCDRTEWIEGTGVRAVEEPDRLTRGGGRIAGVARLEDGIVLIQDLPAFLDAAEQRTLADALAALDAAQPGASTATLRAPPGNNAV